MFGTKRNWYLMVLQVSLVLGSNALMASPHGSSEKETRPTGDVKPLTHAQYQEFARTLSTPGRKVKTSWFFGTEAAVESVTEIGLPGTELQKPLEGIVRYHEGLTTSETCKDYGSQSFTLLLDSLVKQLQKPEVDEDSIRHVGTLIHAYIGAKHAHFQGKPGFERVKEVDTQFLRDLRAVLVKFISRPNVQKLVEELGIEGKVPAEKVDAAIKALKEKDSRDEIHTNAVQWYSGAELGLDFTGKACLAEGRRGPARPPVLDEGGDEEPAPRRAEREESGLDSIRTPVTPIAPPVVPPVTPEPPKPNPDSRWAAIEEWLRQLLAQKQQESADSRARLDKLKADLEKQAQEAAAKQAEAERLAAERDAKNADLLDQLKKKADEPKPESTGKVASPGSSGGGGSPPPSGGDSGGKKENPLPQPDPNAQRENNNQGMSYPSLGAQPTAATRPEPQPYVAPMPTFTNVVPPVKTPMEQMWEMFLMSRMAGMFGFGQQPGVPNALTNAGGFAQFGGVAPMPMGAPYAGPMAPGPGGFAATSGLAGTLGTAGARATPPAEVRQPIGR